MENNNATLFAAIAKVMGEVRSLPKNGYNKQSSYNYVSSDDALDAIGRAMAKHGVVVIPSMVHYDTATDGKMTRAKAEFDMNVCDANGAAFVSRWIAEGIDYGNPDKALTKAITYATKTFLLKLFVVGAGGEDPDGESVPEGEKVPNAAATQRNGKTAAQATTTKTETAKTADPIDKERKAFHAEGVTLFGNEWDAARHHVVERYTTNKTPDNKRSSSNDLSAAELSEITKTFKASAPGWRAWWAEKAKAEPVAN